MISNDNKHDPQYEYGPGNTRWYIDEDGEIMTARWNDRSWRNRTGVYVEEMIGKYSNSWQLLDLLQKAYEAGKKDQLTIIKQVLDIK